jgi:hypothetical protein
MCFYCRQGGHISSKCKKKKKFRQDRRALPAQPVRLLPQNFQKPTTPKIRSTEVEGKQIMLTKDNFREMIQNLDEEDRALVVTELLDF